MAPVIDMSQSFSAFRYPAGLTELGKCAGYFLHIFLGFAVGRNAAVAADGSLACVV
jgi:hypothetical protein